MNAILYIHGKGGNAAESEHYKPFFPDCEMMGLDYQTYNPWDTGTEIHDAVKELKNRYFITVAWIVACIALFAAIHECNATLRPIRKVFE